MCSPPASMQKCDPRGAARVTRRAGGWKNGTHPVAVPRSVADPGALSGQPLEVICVSGLLSAHETGRTLTDGRRIGLTSLSHTPSSVSSKRAFQTSAVYPACHSRPGCSLPARARGRRSRQWATPPTPRRWHWHWRCRLRLRERPRPRRSRPRRAPCRLPATQPPPRRRRRRSRRGSRPAMRISQAAHTGSPARSTTSSASRPPSSSRGC